jgi:PAS domain S-box-containing protein
LLLVALPLLTTMAVSVRLRRVAVVDRGLLQAITREHDMMRKLIDSLPDFIYVKDRQGRFLLANAFCCESMGAEQERLLGRTDFDFYPSGLAESYHDDEQAVMASGRALAARQEDVLVNDGREGSAARSCR